MKWFIYSVSLSDGVHEHAFRDRGSRDLEWRLAKARGERVIKKWEVRA